MFEVCFQCNFGVFVVCLWCVCGVFVVCLWCDLLIRSHVYEELKKIFPNKTDEEIAKAQWPAKYCGDGIFCATLTETQTMAHAPTTPTTSTTSQRIMASLTQTRTNLSINSVAGRQPFSQAEPTQAPVDREHIDSSDDDNLVPIRYSSGLSTTPVEPLTQVSHEASTQAVTQAKTPPMSAIDSHYNDNFDINTIINNNFGFNDCMCLCLYTLFQCVCHSFGLFECVLVI